MNEKFLEKRRRLDDAIALKTPDRVPIFLTQGYLPALTGGITYKDAYYDPEAWIKANRDFVERYDPDMYFPVESSAVIGAGPAHDILGTLAQKWPGSTLPDMVGHQFVEGEYMQQSEYDHFLDDPSDYLLRIFTPRVFKNLAGLAKLPPLKSLSLGCYGTFLWGMTISDPDVMKALEALLAMSKPSAEYALKLAQFNGEMAEAGQMSSSGAPVLHPFDIISDMLRGMRGAMLDMFQVPDKLLAATEKLYPYVIASAIGGAQVSGNPRIFIPLHRGADGFMSPKQFEKFYWPYLKRLLEDLIAAGLTPMPFFEGTYEKRLDYLTQLPPGKILGWFDRSDLSLLKEKLADVMCVCGGMPASMLQTGTPASIRDYTKQIIETYGKRGFVMNTSTMLDEVKPELLEAWIAATREFGA